MAGHLAVPAITQIRTHQTAGRIEMKPTDRTAPAPAQLPGALTAVRGAPYDVYAKLEDPMGVLSIALGQWEDRDDSKPQPEVRRAANTAMDEIDLMLRELYAMRSRLVGEIRVSDDATAARVDAMLEAAKAASREADQ